MIINALILSLNIRQIQCQKHENDKERAENGQEAAGVHHGRSPLLRINKICPERQSYTTM